MMSPGTLRVTTGIATLIALAGGIAVYEHAHGPLPTPPHTVPSPDPTPVPDATYSFNTLDIECQSRYQQLTASIGQIPQTLPNPVIDIDNDPAEFRLYTTPISDTSRQIVFDCSDNGSGSVVANLSVSPTVGTGALGPADKIADYGDYMPDGTAALVGTTGIQAAAVSADSTGQHVPGVEFESGFFVVWPLADNLDSVRVTVFGGNGKTTHLNSPTTVSGTYNQDALLDVCRDRLAAATKTTFKTGAGGPDIQLKHNDFAANIYAGKLTAICTADASQHGAGYNFYTDRPSTGKPVYGMRTFIGDNSGLVTGYVPADVDSVQIIDGIVTIDAQVVHGVFAAWIPANLFTDTTTKIVASSPSHHYTYNGTPTRPTH